MQNTFKFPEDTTFKFIFIVVVIIGLIAIVGLAVIGNDCEKKGGVFIYSQYGSVCVKQDSILK